MGFFRLITGNEVNITLKLKILKGLFSQFDELKSTKSFLVLSASAKRVESGECSTPAKES